MTIFEGSYCWGFGHDPGHLAGISVLVADIMMNGFRESLDPRSASGDRYSIIVTSHFE